MPAAERLCAPRVPLPAAAAVQIAAAIITLCVATLVPGQHGLLAWATVQGLVAAALSRLLRMDPWWLAIHAIFVPGLVGTMALQLEPRYALGVFLALASLYWGVSSSRVPLYLSNHAAKQALVRLLPEEGSFRFIDLGCGLGGVLAHVARERPAASYHGIEAAPLPFALSWLRARLGFRDCRVAWGDFNAVDLGRYDVVYAYLSPAAMEPLWRKACREMRPGCLLISNRFSIPGAPPARSFPAGAPGEPELLLWRM